MVSFNLLCSSQLSRCQVKVQPTADIRVHTSIPTDAYNENVYVLRVGIIKKGGAQPNIIPEETQLHYYLRAPTVGQLDELTKKVTTCFEAAAVATGCQVRDRNCRDCNIAQNKFIRVIVSELTST